MQEYLSSLRIFTTERKLKDKTDTLLHGEHDTLYIGSGFGAFEVLTKEDIKTAVYHGLHESDYDGGFQMYASL